MPNDKPQPLLDVALGCLTKQWFIFPCRPRGKEPMIQGGFHAATNDEAKVREWWSKWPDANVGIATGASGLTVLDIDHGIDGLKDLRALRDATNIASGYAVKTGRKDGFGVQLYFEGGELQSIPWADASQGVSGDIRSATGYVMAAGSIHPSGDAYTVLVDAPLAKTPEFVRGLRSPVSASVAFEDGPITNGRSEALLKILGRYRQGGADDDEILAKAYKINATRMSENPLAESDLDRLAASICKYAVGVDAPTVTLGTAKEPKEPSKVYADWRDRYHSFKEMDEAPPARFLIDGFLQADSITALAAPVGQRKTLIALNIAHALLTGEPLFGHFSVLAQPPRILYLCPEMGLVSFTERVRALGLLQYVGKSLFCQTMNTEDPVKLAELTDAELEDSVLVIDTAVRYLEGSENSVDDMKLFAKAIFLLKKRIGKNGVVLLLHHSPKSTKESGGLSLENAMRGSGELGAFVTSCWATVLKDPDNVYESASYLQNVKQRDFKSEPFDATCSPSCKMTKVPGETAVLSKAVANKDGKEDAAVRIIQDNEGLKLRELVALLKDAGISRGLDWISKKRVALRGAGVTLKTG